MAGSHRLGEGGLCKGIPSVWLLLFSSPQNGKQRNGAEAVTVKDLLPMAHFLTSEFPGSQRSHASKNSTIIRGAHVQTQESVGDVSESIPNSYHRGRLLGRMLKVKCTHRQLPLFLTLYHITNFIY